MPVGHIFAYPNLLTSFQTMNLAFVLHHPPVEDTKASNIISCDNNSTVSGVSVFCPRYINSSVRLHPSIHCSIFIRLVVVDALVDIGAHLLLLKLLLLIHVHHCCHMPYILVATFCTSLLSLAVHPYCDLP